MWKTDRYQVVTIRLDAEPQKLPALHTVLSEDEKVRAARFRHERDRRRYIVARARLRELLAERLGAVPQSIRFQYGRNGKPALAAPYAETGLSFNLAHCEDVALYAFAQAEVGVDVEALRALDDADAIAARCFSRRENETYLALPMEQRPLGFFNCWTRKEAFVKALGEGLSAPLQAFDVSLAPSEPARLLRVDRVFAQASPWRLDAFSPLPGFIAAVCSRT
jgi:4'-phosphopantetheinyl transferase